jgi:hypothetical protein
MHAGDVEIVRLSEDALAARVLLVPSEIEERSAEAARVLHGLFPGLVEHNNGSGAAMAPGSKSPQKIGKESQVAAVGEGEEAHHVKEERFSQAVISID